MNIALIFAPNTCNFNPDDGNLFMVGGIAQIFWTLPMVRKWGRVWYGVGIADILVLMAIWTISGMPGNPLTGRGACFSAFLMRLLVQLQLIRIQYSQAAYPAIHPITPFYP